MLAVWAEAHEVAVPRSGSFLLPAQLVSTVLVRCCSPTLSNVDCVLPRVLETLDVAIRSTAEDGPAPGSDETCYPQSKWPLTGEVVRLRESKLQHSRSWN